MVESLELAGAASCRQSRPMFDIREETQDDWESVDRVLKAAFDGDGEANLVRELRTRGAAVLALVAVEGSEVVGHIMFSPMRDCDGNTLRDAVGLAPVAVVPERQREGIGSQLIREGIARLQTAGIALIAVLGHADYYPRFGFARADERGIENEFGVGPEFMVLELEQGAIARNHGLLQYAEAFSDL